MHTQDIQRLGLWSSLLVTAWVALFGLAMILGLLGMQIGLLPFLAGFLLAPSFVVMMASLHEQTAPAKQIWTRLALAFAVIYAVLVMIVYYVQLTIVPEDKGDLLRPFVYAPGTVFFAVDMLGYGFMCLSTWFAAPAVTGSDSLSVWIRRLLILHGLLVVPTLVTPAFMPEAAPGSDGTFGFLVLLFWCVIFGPLSWLISRHFRRMARSEKGARRLARRA